MRGEVVVRYPICELWLVSGGLEMEVLDSGSAQTSFLPKMMTAPKEHEKSASDCQMTYFAAQGRGFGLQYLTAFGF